MAVNTTKLSPPEKLRLAAKTEIVIDYDQETAKQQKPDEPFVPPFDPTGHIQGVQGHTPKGKVNSKKEKERATEDHNEEID